MLSKLQQTLTLEFEKHDRQDFDGILFRGHHMLEELNQSVNMNTSMGGPNSI